MNNRSDVLQLMRFIAAALVLYAHHTLYYAERIDRSFPWSSLGPPGVALFFIISGLVMVVSTQRVNKDIDGAKQFMLRRLVRVAPMYWLATTLKVSIALILPHLVLHNSLDVVRTIGSYFFIPMFNQNGVVQPILGVGWTLIHEMYFYLVFAGALAMGLRPAWWVSLCIVLVCASGLIWPAESAPMRLVTHTINLYFVIGMCAGILITGDGNTARRRFSFSLILLLLAALGWHAPSALSPFTVQPVALVLAAVMVLAYRWNLPSFMQWVVRLGGSSYALYLFHTFYSTACLLLLHKLMPQWSPWGNIWLSVAIGVPVGHVIYAVIERPLTERLNAKFFRKGSGSSN